MGVTDPCPRAAKFMVAKKSWEKMASNQQCHLNCIAIEKLTLQGK